jgi:hypothetical protein
VRLYDAELGRFTSVDPLWEEQLPYQPYHYALNAPLAYKDPTGEIPIDTFWDAANVVVDVVRLVYHTVKGNKEKAKEAVVDLGYDGLALAVPYLPSGLSKVRHVDDVVDAAKGAGKAADGKKVPDAGKGGCTAPTETGPASSYVEVTRGGSRVPNRSTGVDRHSFEKNLLNSGWSKSVSKDGRTAVFEKDGARYVLRSGAKSTGGPTADFYKPGSKSIDQKIRLETK